MPQAIPDDRDHRAIAFDVHVDVAVGVDDVEQAFEIVSRDFALTLEEVGQRAGLDRLACNGCIRYVVLCRVIGRRVVVKIERIVGRACHGEVLLRCGRAIKVPCSGFSGRVVDR